MQTRALECSEALSLLELISPSILAGAFWLNLNGTWTRSNRLVAFQSLPHVIATQCIPSDVHTSISAISLLLKHNGGKRACLIPVLSIRIESSHGCIFASGNGESSGLRLARGQPTAAARESISLGL